MIFRKKKYVIIFVVILGLFGLVTLILIRPQYAFTNIPSPSGTWYESVYSIRKYPTSRDYYIVKKSARINIMDNDIGIENEEDVAQFFENWFDMNGLKKGNPNASSARCEAFIPGVSEKDEKNYLAHYYPKDDDRFYVSEVVCVAIFPCDTCIDDVFEIILVTGNPHWLDKIEFEFTHPRAY